MSGTNTRNVLARFCDNNWEKGKYFVKTFSSKNLCGRWRGARTRVGWRVWDLGNGTIMLGKANWDKTLQKSPKFSDYRKSIRKQIRPSCRKAFRPHFVFVWFRESNEIQRFERIFVVRSKCFGKELPPLSNFIQTKFFFLLSAEKPSYEFSATVLRRICKQRSSR